MAAAACTCFDRPAMERDTALSHPAESTLGEFSAIYKQHAQPVYYLALRILGDPAHAEDATHDVFLKAFHHLQEFRGESSLRTWLYRIAINHCQNLQKSWHRRTMVDNVDPAFWDAMAASSGNPLRAVLSAELGKRIQEALRQLPEEYRLLLLLIADDELSYAEVGALTKQTADAVRGKLHRARKTFAVLFDQTA